jgi:hypothetical protein
VTKKRKVTGINTIVKQFLCRGIYVIDGPQKILLTETAIHESATPSVLMLVVLTDQNCFPAACIDAKLFKYFVNILRVVFTPSLKRRVLFKWTRKLSEQLDTIAAYYDNDQLCTVLKALDLELPEGWTADDVVAKKRMRGRAVIFFDTVLAGIELCLQPLQIIIKNKNEKKDAGADDSDDE